MDQTLAAAAAYFAADAAAVTLQVTTPDGGFAVITRSGRVIPANSAEEAEHIGRLAAEREVRG